MKVWKMKFLVDDYDYLKPIKAFTYDEIHAFDGRSVLSDWKPRKVTRMEPKKDLGLGDAPGFIIPVFSKRAVDCLKPLIDKHVEVLPLDFKEKEFYAINVITVLEALDYEKSVYTTFSDGKRIMMVEKYAFLPNVVENIPIFRITDERRSKYPLVSDNFKKIVEENKLEGFKFELIWDSDNPTLDDRNI